MDEKENFKSNEIENIEITKSKIKVFNVFLALILISIGFFFGSSINNKEEIKDYKVYVNNEVQTFRNSIGRKVYPIIIDNQVYLPISEVGSYLNYMPIVKENEIYLYTPKETINSKLLDGFKTETLNGEVVDSTIFKEADYTVFMVWATWCKYCREEINSFKNIEEYLNTSNIQIVSVPTDLPLLSVKDTLSEKTIKEVNEKTQNLNFKYHLFRDDILNSKLIGNAVIIPKLVIFDNEGNLIKIIDEVITGEELKNILSEIIK